MAAVENHPRKSEGGGDRLTDCEDVEEGDGRKRGVFHTEYLRNSSTVQPDSPVTLSNEVHGS